jgi:predicted dehydrogenase
MMIKAAVVGCGNIAGFLDAPEDKRIVTHAHAYHIHPDIELVACCDPDLEQREKFLSIWGESIRGYENVEAMLEAEELQILSICSPTPFHAEALDKALNDPHIGYILCEKPFTQNAAEFDRLLPLLQSTEKRVLINFMRRYDPGIRKAAELIKSGELGELRHFSGTFTKGLYHNGSHMLELIEHLCGGLTSISTLSCRENDGDLLGTFYLETQTCRGTLQNEEGDGYALFELDIVLGRGRICIKDAGHRVEVETVQPSQEYAGYYNLKQETVLDDTMSENLYNAIAFLLDSDETERVLVDHINVSRKLLEIKKNLANQEKLEWS